VIYSRIVDVYALEYTCIDDAMARADGKDVGFIPV
jgi:hypothetical protein